MFSFNNFFTLIYFQSAWGATQTGFDSVYPSWYWCDSQLWQFERPEQTVGRKISQSECLRQETDCNLTVSKFTGLFISQFYEKSWWNSTAGLCWKAFSTAFENQDGLFIKNYKKLRSITCVWKLNPRINAATGTTDTPKRKMKKNVRRACVKWKAIC